MYQQIPSDRAVVQKYGGTSVGSTERIKAVAHRIAEQRKRGLERLAVVVSAQSGVTNQLVDNIKGINRDCDPRFYDMAVAAGEQISVALLCAALEAEGVKATPFLAFQLGIMTDSIHSKARIQSIKTRKIEQAWEQDSVAVVAGFQGITSELDITTLGRGGSDTSAVAVAVALDAGFCEINTDVDGVYSADPRVVSKARLLETVDCEVALEMASLGSKVLHPRCVELAAKFKMPLVVRNSFKPDDHIRTIIMPNSEGNPIEALVVDGVTLDRNVARMTLGNLKKDSTLISDIFTRLAEKSINVDIIIQNMPEAEKTMKIGFTVNASELDAAKRVIGQIVEEKAHGAIQMETEDDLAKVSVIGVGMRSYPGVAARTFSALTAKGIDIHMISTSEIKISCVVEEKDAVVAAETLHDEFISSSNGT